MSQRIKVSWNGEEKSIELKFGFIRYLDNYFNTRKALIEYTEDTIDTSDGIEQLALILRYAGFDVTADSIYDDLRAGGTLDVRKVFPIVRDILTAVYIDSLPPKKGSPTEDQAETT